MKTRTIIALVLAAAVMAAAPDPAQAQSRYQQWSNPEAPEAKSEMLKELQGLIDQAEKDRAADPQFLRDLRDLIRKYDRPATAELFFDDFRDGNFDRDPAWQVVAGEYWIEQGYGLRSVIEPRGTTQGTTTAEKPASDKDRRKALTKALLGELLGQKTQTQDQGSGQASAATHAAIRADAPISNAFTLRLDLTSWKAPGRFEMGVFQGQGSDIGYRLVYNPGAEPSFELVRVSSRGTGIIGTSTALATLEDQRVHAVEWRRAPNGVMTVLVDETEVLSAQDRGFRDPFDGLVLINGGGDFIVSKVVIDGTAK